MKIIRLIIPLFCTLILWVITNYFNEPSVTLSAEPSPVTMITRERSQFKVISSLAPSHFTHWLESYLEDPNAADFETGRVLATERRHVLKQMIQLDPEKALALAIPNSQRASLPPEIESLLEIPDSTPH